MSSFLSHNDPYQSLIEEIPAITYTATLEREFRPVFVSPQIESILGIGLGSLTGNGNEFIEHIHPDDRARVVSEREESASTMKPFSMEYRMVSQDGRKVWFRDQATVYVPQEGAPVLFKGVMVDITDRKRVEDELVRWDRETKSLTENIPDMIGRFDRRLRFLYLNRWIDSMSTIPVETYLGKTNRGMGLSVEIADLWDDSLRLVFEKNQPRVVDFSVPTREGTRFLESHIVPESNSQGVVETVLAVTRDLTDRRKGELALRESEERFRQLAETIGDVFWLGDVFLRRVVYVSPAYERLWGASSQELLEDPEKWLTVIHPEDRASVQNRFYDKFMEGTYQKEYRVVLPDGTTRWIQERVFPVTDEKGRIYRIAGIAEDVTVQKKFEEERVRTSKLDSLGLLAGGLAHDFNNLLTAILGQLSLAKFSLSPQDRLFQRLSDAECASFRAQELTQQLLTFAKGGTPVKKAASLQQIVEESTQFVLSGSNVKYSFHFPQNSWTVEIDVGQMSQVVQNLVINAKQAMPNGGQLVIHGSNVVIGPEGSKGWLGIPMGKWVRVSFTDQGSGIPKENLFKIFDPYFTTKTSGSGLGLATSYSIIKNHGGLLTVDSEMGTETTFTMYLPASPHAEVTQEVKESNLHKGKGKILIMDDEASIRGLLEEMLELCGYASETAKDGAEAVSLYCQAMGNGLPFDAVILDLTIPGGMGGKEAIEKLIDLDPHVKGIVLSGYSNDPILAKFKEYGFKEKISKPFKITNLSKVVHEVIEGPPNI